MRGQIYSFDTSALIDGAERYYPIDNFPALWENIDQLISEGRLRISEEAWTESLAADAPLKDWLTEDGAARDRAKHGTDAVIASVAGAIVSTYPSWSKKGGKNGADPFVIAVAEVVTGKVISGEQNGGPAKPKIPYVCSQRGTPHGALVDVIRDEQWRFG